MSKFTKKKGVSKRQIARAIKAEKENYFKKISISNETYELGETSRNISIDSDSTLANCSDKREEIDLKEKLKKWNLEYHPSRRSFDALLQILNSENLNVPTSSKTLLRNSEKAIIRTVPPGHYWHNGIKSQLQKVTEIIFNYEEVVIDIGIDGLPLYKSSNMNLWPILAKIINIPNINIFLIGAYVGNTKPLSIESYLHDFIYEVKDLFENGILIKDKRISFRIRAFICDAPAKSFLCGIMGHTSYKGCTKCCQTGHKIDGIVTYATKAGIAISDKDFEERKYAQFHQNYFKNRQTPLEEIGIKMVSQFPIDPMHLIDLGVTKKYLIRLLENKILHKVNKENKDCISFHLQTLYKFIPKEFVRKPRSMQEVRRWKATEFRQFILYTGILVLRQKVHEDVYYIFLLLHVAYRLLSCPRSFLQNLTAAQSLLETFVQNFAVIFGENSITYNIHHLLHITECVAQHGVVTNFSAYQFENQLQILKKLIKKPTHILQQLSNKLKCENLVIKDKVTGFRLARNKIISYTSNRTYLSLKEPDNCICMTPYIPIIITGFEGKDGNKFVLGRRLVNLDNFFTEPVESKDLGIYTANTVPANEEEIYNLNEISCKLMRLPFENQVLLIPILHDCC